METLRESQPSLFRTMPDHDVNGIIHEVSITQDVLRRTQPSPAVDSPFVEHTVASENRFARDFTDPLFPCHQVTYSIVKRFFDLMISITMLLLLSPIMVIAALLVRFTSPGPVIFRQVRVGRGGRHFWCYKFRSMCVDAEAQKNKLMHLNEASGPVFKIKRDPRITRVGVILRKFSIDELPQLFNVFNGDMSIVGPRPPLPTEVESYGVRERRRLAVRPGLTCLWQVSGRSNVSFDRWVELDILYIETMSFTNDVKIVIKTVPAVLKSSGAH